MDLNRVKKIDRLVSVRNVLISVADKSGLEDFINGLVSLCPDIRFYSTGGTYKAIEKILAEDAKNRLIAVSDYTGQPEMQGGLVKTLDFKIYMGLLSETYNPAHQDDLKRTGSVIFDMVVVNLYPFEETVSDENASLEDGRTHIDIGGPCMLRASAKNFLRVASVSSISQYKKVLSDIEKNNGALSYEMRLELAGETFKRTAGYDAAISDFLIKKASSFEESPYSEDV
ncbi:hypothetical protein WKV44_04945 [Spirochaetia bacterium 38H-sp]|uniref:MGS-like domain-containing protein n=1 Tax=Rarispira pelagica TaxID=3141764 RepID=A0ABU9UB48_9SPIR